MTDHASKKILIVDDEPEMRIAITEALKREGYQTDSAENAPDALHRLEGEEFDLVISDVKMPKMSGQELLRTIKEQSPNTPRNHDDRLRHYRQRGGVDEARRIRLPAQTVFN